ncbi:hypothetical protein J6590_048512 [Homalodisca vitripennis]|nr:hypothetical protein J6590_048512 [Homalodisca vitripennis]
MRRQAAILSKKSLDIVPKFTLRSRERSPSFNRGNPDCVDSRPALRKAITLLLCMYEIIRACLSSALADSQQSIILSPTLTQQSTILSPTLTLQLSVIAPDHCCGIAASDRKQRANCHDGGQLKYSRLLLNVLILGPMLECYWTESVGSPSNHRGKPGSEHLRSTPCLAIIIYKINRDCLASTSLVVCLQPTVLSPTLTLGIRFQYTHSSLNLQWF